MQVWQQRRHPWRPLASARIFRLMPLLVALLCATARAQKAGNAAAPQGTGTVYGTVLSESHEPVAGVKVSVQGTTLSVVTDPHGAFRISGVPVGSVVVVAQVIGRPSAQLVVRVSAGQSVEVNLTLRPYELPAVQVSASPYGIDTATAATKTAAPLMETPVAVSVVPRAVIADQGAITLQDAVQYVAGVIPVTDFQLPSYNVRGFDLDGAYFDNGLRTDTYTISGFARDMVNVESVQIVKGPESVLYGQAEPGGLVDVVTKVPLEQGRYSFEEQAGSFSNYRSTVDATGPLNGAKTFLYRLSAAYQNSNSFRDFIYQHSFQAYPSLEWRPSRSDRVLIEGSYGTGTTVSDQGLPFLVDGSPANVPVTRNFNEPDANASPTTQYSIGLRETHNISDRLSLRLSYRSAYVSQPGAGYQELFFSQADSSGNLTRFWTTTPVFWHWTHQVVLDATERFATGRLAHTVVGGVDYYGMKGFYTYNETGFVTPAPSINIYNPVYGLGYGTLDPADTGSTTQYQHAYGAYLQDQIGLGRVHVLAGARFDRQTSSNTGYGTVAATVEDKPPVTPRLGILWQAVPAFSVYTTYTGNYGATPLGVVTKDSTLLPPQSARQFEVGVKAELFDRRLIATVSGYQLTKENIPTADPTNPGFDIAVGQSRSRGVELDVTGAITRGWQVTGGYAYCDARVIQDNNGLQGLRFIGAPYNSGSVWTTYAVSSGPLRGIKIGAGVVARDGEVDFSNDHIPGFAMINAMVEYSWALGRTTGRAQLNVNNVLDRRYFAGLTGSAAMPGTPRSLLASLHVDL